MNLMGTEELDLNALLGKEKKKDSNDFQDLLGEVKVEKKKDKKKGGANDFFNDLMLDWCFIILIFTLLKYYSINSTINILLMLGKENRFPVKQGVMYELNLDKDQGPYLSKDIMHSNPKSIALLAGSQIVKSFSTLNQTLKFT